MNPLLEKSSLKFEAIDFNKIKAKHYLPALEASVEEAQSNIEKIKNEIAPTFENIIVALECAADRLDYISDIFYSLFSAHCTDELADIAEDFNRILTNFSSDVSLDEKLFKQVKNIYDLAANIPAEDRVLLENTYKDFTRNGALLDKKDKEALREIDQDLALLSLKFSENIRHSINEYALEIHDEKDLVGLPDSVIEAARETAKDKGLKANWAFSLEFPSYYPFMQYSQNRELREKLWKASTNKAFEGKFENKTVIHKTLRLRQKRAALLGYKDHPEYILEKRMAKDSETVMSFVDRIIEAAMPKAKEDVLKLQSLKKELTGDDDLRKYDVPFYSELLKKKELDFDDEELRPYLKLENVIGGVFDVATKLYNLSFKKLTDIPTYHKDVDVFEVTDSRGEYIGLFYTDFFPRSEKKSGAWMTDFRKQGLQFGEVKRPFVSIVCNFTKPTDSRPSLLTLDEALTLFHEFGHALHGLLANTKYKSISGTNVLWDFVELPSQIMENWVLEKECLSLFAKHYKTGEVIPDELIEKVKKSSQFLQGLATIRQMSFSHLDMSWHLADSEQIKCVETFEKDNLNPFELYPSEVGAGMMSCSFSHIFAGGYSAGYYSYKWAEVLDADAFAYFKERGIFDPEVAASFKENILTKGGTADPMELYKKFRGGEPDVNALLERAGLI